MELAKRVQGKSQIYATKSFTLSYKSFILIHLRRRNIVEGVGERERELMNTCREKKREGLKV